MKRTFRDCIPPWTEVRDQRNLCLVSVGAALFFSLVSYFPTLLSAYNDPYRRLPAFLHSEFPADTAMPYFADLISSQGHVSNFYSLPALFPCLLLALGAVVLAAYNYGKLWRGSKPVYLMARLPDRWELHRRCLGVPLGLLLAALVLAALLLLVYYGVYRLLTPAQWLRPGQLARLQELFAGLFLPFPRPGWG